MLNNLIQHDKEVNMSQANSSAATGWTALLQIQLSWENHRIVYTESELLQIFLLHVGRVVPPLRIEPVSQKADGYLTNHSSLYLVYMVSRQICKMYTRSAIAFILIPHQRIYLDDNFEIYCCTFKSCKIVSLILIFHLPLRVSKCIFFHYSRGSQIFLSISMKIFP